MATQFKIEAAKNTSATSVSTTIRNIGTQTISLAQIAAYLSGSPIVIAAGNTGTLAVGSTQTLTLTVPASPAVCGLTLTLTIGTGLTDSKAVSC
jgi:hypothetical protein